MTCPRCGGPRHLNPELVNLAAGRIVADEMDFMCPVIRAFVERVYAERLA